MVKKKDDEFDVEAKSRRTDEGDFDQVDGNGKGLPVEEGEPVKSPREGTSGTDVGYLTRPR